MNVSPYQKKRKEYVIGLYQNLRKPTRSFYVRVALVIQLAHLIIARISETTHLQKHFQKRIIPIVGWADKGFNHPNNLGLE